MLRVARRGVLLIEPHDYVVELQYIKNLGEHAESFVVSGHWFHSARRERAELHHARLSEPCAVQFSFSTPTVMDQLSAGQINGFASNVCRHLRVRRQLRAALQRKQWKGQLRLPRIRE